MASGWTNRGRLRVLEWAFRDTGPTNLYARLITNAVVPTADTNTAGELTEITAGNGYTAGGIQLVRSAVDFDVSAEDDALDLALLQLKDLVWTASVGPIPASGSGARYCVLTDDNATDANREIINFWDLGTDRSVIATQSLVLIDSELRLKLPA